MSAPGAGSCLRGDFAFTSARKPRLTERATWWKAGFQQGDELSSSRTSPPRRSAVTGVPARYDEGRSRGPRLGEAGKLRRRGRVLSDVLNRRAQQGDARQLQPDGPRSPGTVRLVVHECGIRTEAVVRCGPQAQRGMRGAWTLRAGLRHDSTVPVSSGVSIQLPAVTNSACRRPCENSYQLGWPRRKCSFNHQHVATIQAGSVACRRG